MSNNFAPPPITELYKMCSIIDFVFQTIFSTMAHWKNLYLHAWLSTLQVCPAIVGHQDIFSERSFEWREDGVRAREDPLPNFLSWWKWIYLLLINILTSESVLVIFFTCRIYFTHHSLHSSCWWGWGSSSTCSRRPTWRGWTCRTMLDCSS